MDLPGVLNNDTVVFKYKNATIRYREVLNLRTPISDRSS